MARDFHAFMTQNHGILKRHSRRYPATRTSPWFFLLLLAVTVTLIVSGIFQINPVTRVLHFLAVVF